MQLKALLLLVTPILALPTLLPPQFAQKFAQSLTAKLPVPEAQSPSVISSIIDAINSYSDALHKGLGDVVTGLADNLPLSDEQNGAENGLGTAADSAGNGNKTDDISKAIQHALSAFADGFHRGLGDVLKGLGPVLQRVLEGYGLTKLGDAALQEIRDLAKNDKVYQSLFGSSAKGHAGMDN